jgi:Sap, sulfolipid-1-addressing protein
MVELLPLALVITVSPLSIIPGVLVLHAPHPRETSLAYLAGWLFRVGRADADLHRHLGHARRPGTVTSGVGVLAAGRRRCGAHRVRRHPLADATWPRPHTGLGAIDDLGDSRAICAAAGLAIGTGALGVAGTVLSAALFVGVAASSVAIPVLAYGVAGDRLDAPLERLKDWMEKRNAALVAAILVLIGLVLLYKGIHAL